MRGSAGPAHPSTPGGVGMEGRRAQLPVSGWGASSLHCVCPPFPGAPHPGEGPCMSGGPLPLPKPLSVSVSLCCLYTRLGVLTLVLTVNVNRPILRVPLDTRTAVSTLSVHHIPRLASPPTAAAINTRINTYRGSHSI